MAAVRVLRFFGAAALAVIAIVGPSTPAEAHRSGCHAAHSCPSDSGSYVCGDKGIYTYCGGGGSSSGGSSSGGSSSSSGSSFTAPPVDYDAPEQPSIAAPKALAGGQVRVEVIAERGSALRVGSDGQKLYGGTATGSRQTLTFEGLEGPHTYNVTATDLADNVSDVARFDINADATPPSTDGLRFELGDAEFAAARFLVAPGESASYEVLIDGSVVKQGKLAPSGAEFLLPIGNGKHAIEVLLADRVGNKAKFAKSVSIAIPSLSPIAQHETPANSSVQEFLVKGAPGTTGTLTVGEIRKAFTLDGEQLAVPIELPDGQYAAPVVHMQDKFGRRGSASLAAFVVDTVRPRLTWRDGDDGSYAGKIAALVLAEEGARIAWRLLDESEEVVDEGTYLADDATERLVRDVDEGDYVLVVSATDEAGNEITDRFQMKIGPDPLTRGEWVTIAFFLALLAWLLWFLWRRREAVKRWLASQKHAAAVRQAQRSYDAALAKHQQALVAHSATMARHKQAMVAWNQRKEEIEGLLEEARTFTGSGAVLGAFKLVKLRRGERIFSATSAQLVEQRTRQNIPVLAELEHGRVAVTSERVIFTGGKGRTWDLAKLEGIRQHDASTYLMKVSNRVRNSGVRCSEPEKFRLHLDLALADLRDDRSAVIHGVGQRLHAHNGTMPADPPPPPAPPQKPALLSMESGQGDAAVPVTT